MPLDDRTPSLPRSAEGLSHSEGLAVAFAAAWMVIVAILFLLIPEAESTEAAFESIRWTLMAIVMFTPIAMVLLGLVVFRSMRELRDENYRLRTAVDGLRHTYVTQQSAATTAKAPVATAPAPKVPDTPAEEPSQFRSRREVSRLITPRAAPQEPNEQATLALGEETPVAALDRADLIRALNFPDDEDDKEGFAALRRALKDRSARLVVQASQDVLTLLAEDGIYTDAFTPDAADIDLWRAFAKGERGTSIKGVGAVKDDDMHVQIVSRMRDDQVFRDAVHHFLRRFDEILMSFEVDATDTDLIAFADTRTSRAFMVLARATGAFD